MTTPPTDKGKGKQLLYSRETSPRPSPIQRPRYTSSVTLILVRSDDFLSLSFSSFLFTLCTILRPQDATPRTTCDSKSPMTGKLGPPVRPRFPIRYPIDSRAWPSPLWAHNAFSYVLLLSLQTRTVSRLQSLLFDSVLFYSTAPLISFTSIRFCSIPFDPFLRCSLSYPRPPSLVVYKPLYDLGEALSLT